MYNISVLLSSFGTVNTGKTMSVFSALFSDFELFSILSYVFIHIKIGQRQQTPHLSRVSARKLSRKYASELYVHEHIGNYEGEFREREQKKHGRHRHFVFCRFLFSAQVQGA